jgi:hypothetical protein
MAGGGSNTLRAVLKELGWSRTRLVAELRRQAASSGESLPGTESLIAMVSRWVNNHQQPNDFYRDLLARTLVGPERSCSATKRPGWSWRPRPSRGCWPGRWRPPRSARPPWRTWRRRWGSSPAHTRARPPPSSPVRS